MRQEIARVEPHDFYIAVLEYDITTERKKAPHCTTMFAQTSS